MATAVSSSPFLARRRMRSPLPYDHGPHVLVPVVHDAEHLPQRPVGGGLLAQVVQHQAPHAGEPGQHAVLGAVAAVGALDGGQHAQHVGHPHAGAAVHQEPRHGARQVGLAGSHGAADVRPAPLLNLRGNALGHGGGGRHEAGLDSGPLVGPAAFGCGLLGLGPGLKARTLVAFRHGTRAAARLPAAEGAAASQHHVADLQLRPAVGALSRTRHSRRPPSGSSGRGSRSPRTSARTAWRAAGTWPSSGRPPTRLPSCR